jgi:hypothetical protein
LIALGLSTLVVVACSQPTAPTRSTAASAGSPSTGTTGGAVSAATASSITFVTDTVVQGSEAQLTGFDLNTLTLSYSTTKGAFSATILPGTVFRDAQLARFHPTDPCRDVAQAYNDAGLAADASPLLQAITLMAGSGCLARIQTGKADASIPGDPMRRFRPLPAF